jgi:hypothetical protein
MEMKVASYGPSKTHWWPLSVQATPIEPVTQPATVDSSSTIDSDVLVAQSVSTYPVFDGGRYARRACRGRSLSPDRCWSGGTFF